jgi:hypothetical protein
MVGKKYVLLVSISSALLFLTSTGCIKGKRNNIEAQSDGPVGPVSDEPIVVSKSEKGLLDIQVTIRDDGMLLNISNIPSGAILECDLNDKPLVPCHDGAFFLRPDVGDHVINAVALKDGSLVSAGESKLFTVTPMAQGDIDSIDRGSLALTMDVPSFSNATTLPVSADFTAKFKFADKNLPKDCKPIFRCKYDSRTSQFWTSCDHDSQSYTVSKDIMAMGLQYLSMQATCSDQVGPILTIFWYGVPDNYKPLMLQAVKDPAGKAIVTLVRDSDCPEGQQIFECSPDAATPFVKCETGNAIAGSKKGARVRLHCDNQTGPEFIFE